MNQIEKGQKDIGGVELETRKVFNECIDHTMELKNIPTILQYSNEFYHIPCTDDEERNLLKELKSDKSIIPFLPK